MTKDEATDFCFFRSSTPTSGSLSNLARPRVMRATDMRNVSLSGGELAGGDFDAIQFFNQSSD
jgi:hypothetical protein